MFLYAAGFCALEDYNSDQNIYMQTCFLLLLFKPNLRKKNSYLVNLLSALFLVKI